MPEIALHSPAHIGTFVREVVDGHGLNVVSAARALGVTRQALSNLLNGRGGLSPEMALRIEKAFGVRMDTMLRMQTSWQIAEARKHESEIDIRPYLVA